MMVIHYPNLQEAMMKIHEFFFCTSLSITMSWIYAGSARGNPYCQEDLSVCKGQIINRIDIDSINLEQFSSPGPINEDFVQQEMRIDELVSKIWFLEGEEFDKDYLRYADNLVVETGTYPQMNDGYRLVVDRSKGKLYLGNSEIQEDLSIRVPEEHFVTSTKLLLTTLGICEKEVHTLRSSALVGQGINYINGERFGHAEPKEFMKVFYVYRGINGVPLLGNRLIFVYRLDGKLNKIAGRWLHIDYQHSVFIPKPSSIETILDRIATTLLEREVNPSGSGTIKIRHVYYPSALIGTTLFTVSPKLLITVQKDDGDGGYSPESYLIDI
jgi:hypothetical protein